MALYEINDIQKQALETLIKRADIKGVDAAIVVTLLQTLQRPVKTPEIKESESGGKK